MDHGGMSGMDHGSMQGMNHGTGGGSMESGSMSMSHDMRDKSLVPSDVKVGVGVDMIAPMPVDRTGDKPLGLEDVPHRVLTYHDLAPLTPFHDKREPTRSVRSEEHTSELQSLMRISYAVFCLKQK